MLTRMSRTVRIAAALLPYASVLVGLHVLHSAWITVLLYHGGIIALLGRSTSWHRLRQGFAPGPALGLAFFGLCGGAVLWLLAPAAGIDAARITPILTRLGLGGVAWPAFVLYHGLVNPWFEEALWRGALGRDDVRPVATDVIFAGYHTFVLEFFVTWGWIVLAVGMLTLAAWLWRQMARRYHGLLMPALSHLAADASIMVAVYVIS